MSLSLKSNALARGWSFALFFLFLGASLSQAQTITNSDALTYTGNSSAGSATILNPVDADVRLLFENHATAGSASIYNGHSDETDFDNDSTAGSAAITNNGVVYFNGDGDGVNFSTAGHSTIANNGLMEFTDYSTAGSAVISNADNDSNSLDFFNHSTAGSALITNGVSDTMNFEDESTAGGAAIVNNGNLYFLGDGGGVTFSTAGNASVTNNGYIEFDDYSTAGAATITNGAGVSSTLAFFNNSTAGNALILNGSGDKTDFHDDSTAGLAEVSNTGLLDFNDQSTAGSAQITNSWQMYFNDASTAGGSSIVNDGSLYFEGDGNGADFSTAGNADITNNGGIVFEDYSTAGNAAITTAAGGGLFFLDHSTGGGAQLAANGSGFVDFSDSDASQTQGTQFTVGSIAGSGRFYLGQVDLVTGSNNLSTTLTGSIYDGGDAGYINGASLTKTGTGTFTLTGDNYYTGGTNVDSGTLAVESGQSLGGGGVSLSGGNLSIEGPVTLLVNNYYTQSAGSTLTLGLSTPASQGELAVDGAATIDGSLAVTSVGGVLAAVGQSFLVLDTAGGVTGTFASVDSEISSLRFLPVYETDDVLLETLPGSFAQLGATPNEKAVGASWDHVFNDPYYYNLMKSLGTQSVSQLAFDLKPLDPSGLTPLFRMSFSLIESQSAVVGQRLDQLFGLSGFPESGFAKYGNSPRFASTLPAGDEKAQADQISAEGRVGFFLEGEGNFGDIIGDGNAAGYNFSMGGMAAGFDYRLAKDLVGGLLLGYGQGGTSASGSQVTSTSGLVGLYGGWKDQGWHLQAMLDGGLNQYKTARASLGGAATGSTQGLAFGGQVGVGYDMKAKSFMVGPFASAQYTYVQMNAYQETGAMPESFPSQGQGAFTVQLGARVGTRFSLGGGMQLAPMISAAWEHWFQGGTDFLTADFGTADSSFTVAGPNLGSDAAVLGAGLQARFAEGFGASVEYQGKLGLSNYSSQSLNGSLNIGF